MRSWKCGTAGCPNDVAEAEDAYCSDCRRRSERDHEVSLRAKLSKPNFKKLTGVEWIDKAIRRAHQRGHDSCGISIGKGEQPVPNQWGLYTLGKKLGRAFNVDINYADIDRIDYIVRWKRK